MTSFSVSSLFEEPYRFDSKKSVRNISMADLESDLTWGCYIPSLLTELQFHRSWSSETRYSTVPSLRSPSLAVYPQSHTLLRYTTTGENVTNNTSNMTHLILKALHQNHPHIRSANHPHPQANEIHTLTRQSNWHPMALAPPTFSGPQRVPSIGESSLERQEPLTEHQRIWQMF